MTVTIEFIDETNVRRHAEAPGQAFNQSSDTYVQLRPVTVPELCHLWDQFKITFRSLCASLFTTKTADVINEYGFLAAKSQMSRLQDLEYGLLCEKKSRQFTMFWNRDVVQALASIGAIPDSNARGEPRRRVYDVLGIVEALSSEKRHELVVELLAPNRSLDDTLYINQTSVIGDREIEDYLASATSASDALQTIANRTESFFTDQMTAQVENKVRGSGRVYAWAWFAQHLSTRGYWLQPPTHISDILNLYPRKLSPLSAWMAVPPQLWPAADLVWSRMRAEYDKSGAAVMNVFLTVAQCSTMFHGAGLTTWPLVFFKEWTYTDGTAKDLRSSSANHLFKVLCSHHGVVPEEQDTAEFFFGSRRIGANGVEPFAWCDNPTDFNTRVVSRCLGHEVKTVPSYVRDWAAVFREILPLWKTLSFDNQIEELNTWLIFVLHLGEEDAPKSFADIKRSHHVNNDMAHGNTYVNFLKKHFADTGRSIAYRAPSTMSKAFKFAADRYNLPDHVTQPFNPSKDRVGKAKKRGAKSKRPAMDLEVANIISRENRKNGFEFAKSMKRRQFTHWRMCRNEYTGEFENVFFPLAPVLIDIIIHTGYRNRQARWLDSGEGDDQIVDIEARSYVDNPAKTRQIDRQQAFIRLVDVHGDDGKVRTEFCRFANTNKTGSPFQFPWLDPEVAKNAAMIADLQATYNPISRPINPQDKDKSSGLRLKNESPLVPTFPLFRDPKYSTHQAISGDIVRNYWRELCIHCEPIIQREIGYRVPLLRDGRSIYDIHSLRVSIISNLSEQGVSLDVLQDLAGHSCIGMTNYYNVIKSSRVHREMQRARGKRSSSFVSDEAIIDEVLEAPFHAPGSDDPVGIALLQKHRDTPSAPIDFFNHSICPGGDCNTGGKRGGEGRHKPVFRQRACSRCRYRVTGPRFVGGLGLKAASLMVEFKFLQEQERQLNSEADRAEDDGKSASRLRSHAARVRETRDEVFLDWLAERTTHSACKSLRKSSPNSLTSMSPEFDIEEASGQFKVMHQLENLHSLVVISRLNPSILIDLPPGAEEIRDKNLYRVAMQNGLDDLLRKFHSDDTRETIDEFGDYLVFGSADPDELQRILDGHLLIKDVPGLRDLSQFSALTAR